MNGKASSCEILRRLKARLIPVLSGHADFVLQHADSRSLVTPQGYRQIKSCRIPDEKIRDLLDHIIESGPKASQGLLDLLRCQELQETFPTLDLIKDTKVDVACFDCKISKRKRKNKKIPEIQEDDVPSKRNYKMLVTEKQLMRVARALGQSWRQVSIMALEISSVKLEQIVADHPNCQVTQVFTALCYWRNVQRDKATAQGLHALLSQQELALPQEAFSFLLDDQP
ncbi:unnamed protein product [Knipowitschia caucasica]|uniref:CARD domain-containing protein n=1 Tax=Knipowitschia caucasica TaxID=637954 RepID=A0AAV2LYS7_KNICA